MPNEVDSNENIAPVETVDLGEAVQANPPKEEEGPKKRQIKPILSSKVGSWSKTVDGEVVSWVRRGGLGVLEQGSDGVYAIVPDRETEEILKLGPFHKVGRARDAAEEYLHQNGFVYYRDDVIRSNEYIRKLMRSQKKNKTL